MRLVEQSGCVVVVALLGSLVVRAVHGNASLTLLTGFATAALIVAAYRWIVRRTERRVPAELTTRGAGRASLGGTSWVPAAWLTGVSVLIGATD